MDRKNKFYLNLETLRNIFQICPRVHGQDFDELIVSLFKELGHTGEIKSIIDVVVDQMHQPWRTFATIINRSLSRKTSGLDKLCLSRAQTLSGMYYKKNVDYVELLWEDFTYQIDNRGHKKQEKMYYPRFTNVIIYYFLTKDKTAIKFKKLASPKLTTIPASPKEPTKKSKRVKRPAKNSTNAPIAGVVIRDTLGVSVSKKKAPAKAGKGKGIELLSDASLFKDAQLKKALKKSKQETHKLQASSLSEGDDFKSEVPDESKAKSLDTSEGTGVKPRVLDVSKADSFESVNESWEDSEDNNESDDNNDKGSENDDDDGNDAQRSKRTDSDEEENHNLNLNVDVEEETQEEEYVHTPDYSVPTDNETDDVNKEFDDEEYDDLYKDLNVRSKLYNMKK
nr:hypothetical protein [Tanacetum cinerariifolium]